MITLTHEQLADIVGGELVEGDPAGVVDTVRLHPTIVSHSRVGTVYPVPDPAPGESDEHHLTRYVTRALASGATCLLLTPAATAEVLATERLGVALITVDDLADALLGLGVWLAQELEVTPVAALGEAAQLTELQGRLAVALGVSHPLGPHGWGLTRRGIERALLSATTPGEVVLLELGEDPDEELLDVVQTLSPPVQVVALVDAPTGSDQADRWAAPLALLRQIDPPPTEVRDPDTSILAVAIAVALGHAGEDVAARLAAASGDEEVPS